MKKKEYQKPAINIVQLKQRQQLLTGSGTGAGIDVTLEEEEWIPSASRMGLPDE